MINRLPLSVKNEWTNDKRVTIVYEEWMSDKRATTVTETEVEIYKPGKVLILMDIVSNRFYCSNRSSVVGGSFCFIVTSQRAFTCSKLTIETLEQGVKYIQS